MHRHRRARGKIFFELLCALLLAASFAGAWEQTGSSALLGSASIMALFALYWSFGLVARDPVAETARVTPAVAAAQVAVAETAVLEQVYAFEPEMPAAPELVAAAPKKKRVRKAQKVAAVVAPLVEPPEPVAIEEPVYDGPPLEQLFDTQPFVRQPRAFGRKARGPRPVSVG